MVQFLMVVAGRSIPANHTATACYFGMADGPQGPEKRGHNMRENSKNPTGNPDEDRHSDQPETQKRKHRASYSTDKKNGGYLIRIVGPNSECFAGREVPVNTKAGTEHQEKLERLIWTGPDKETGEKVALYRFASKPREIEAEVEF